MLKVFGHNIIRLLLEHKVYGFEIPHCSIHSNTGNGVIESWIKVFMQYAAIYVIGVPSWSLLLSMTITSI